MSRSNPLFQTKAARLHPVLTLLLSFALLFVAGAGSGCQKVSDMKKAAEDASKALEQAENAANSQEAGERMGEAFQKLRETAGGGKVVQAIDFRKLKPVLPASIDGMEAGDVKGSRSSQMGFSTSKAEAHFKADGEQRQSLTIAVTDMGSMSGLSSLSSRMSAWTESETESTDGYERSAEIAGYDGREKFRSYGNGGSTGQLQFIVAERFQVQVDGRNVPMDKMKAAARSVDFDALEGMKDEGVGVDDGKQEEVADMYKEFREAEKKNAASSAEGEPVSRTPVDANELKALFPATLAGLTQSASSSKTQALGENASVVRAEAEYADGDKQLSMHVIDYVQVVPETGVLPGATWMMFDVNKESDNGYEKTTEIQGHPAKETFRTTDMSMRGEVQMVVDGRFFVEVTAQNLTMEEVKSAIADVGPTRITNLARSGA
ncbi:hypothetical protein CRI94_16790 [Longibacter salinarum]|uniref:Uncharacterized protein n=1 Tax=Longibacter salinarum TaxID=1850348 RepID=A0A2A8CTQ7_9BACT|nr:hypothetical protein [Longibacter salinarum]PEN11078.1 hypothetical protein CRI94_16790 [Longibacter salinarum]